MENKNTELTEINEETEVMDLEPIDTEVSAGGSKVGVAIGVALIGAAAAGAVAVFKKSKLQDKINDRRAAKLEKAGYEVYGPVDELEEDCVDEVEDSDGESDK